MSSADFHAAILVQLDELFLLARDREDAFIEDRVAEVALRQHVLGEARIADALVAEALRRAN